MLKQDINVFVGRIKQLPEQTKYKKEQLLNEDFLMEKKGNIEIYYAPFDYINTKAKIVIVGITPGWNQMEKAFSSFKRALIEGKSLNECMHFAKMQASFARTMRKNLIKMLDEIHLNEIFYILTCQTLFFENNNLLHSTSILRYPVFVKGKNYNGHNPEMYSENLLREYILKIFIEEINTLEHSLIIPLGKAVSNMIEELSNEHLIGTNYCLFGFPHPSGANGHRKKQFEEYKESFISLILFIFLKDIF